MYPRTKSILDRGVRGYIETGLPITSEHLYEKYDFGIKPAMIRWELNKLSKAGYLYQTHPSGGRFPTDRAYRFYVRELLEERGDAGFSKSKNDRFADVVEHFLEGERDRFIETVADSLKMLSVGYEPTAEWFAQSGFRGLCEMLELETKDEFMEIVNDFESLQDRVEFYSVRSRGDDRWPKVFVGGGPITKSRHLSVVAHRLAVEEGNVLVIAIGPKRMDYEGSIGLLQSLERAL